MKRLSVVSLAIILLCVLPSWNSGRPEATFFSDGGSSQTTYLGVNTENATLESLMAASENRSGDIHSVNITPISDWAPVQSRPVGVGGIVLDENEITVTDGGSILSESQSDESGSFSSINIQILIVLVITALLFMISQASSCKPQCIRGIHR